MTTYIRCQHLNDQDIQCEEFFARETDGEGNFIKFCERHRNIARVNGSSSEKELYIERVNNVRKQCALMTLEELEDHIGILETKLEEVRNEVLAARATRRDKLDKLSEEEREERRKIKISKPEKPQKEKKLKKATLKSDPVAYYMQSFGMSEIDAKKLLGIG